MNNQKQISFGKKQLDLLEKLSNAVGVSGHEGQVRKIILEEIKPFTSDVKVDALGNIIAVCKSTVKNPMRVMLAAHMDEVGMMLVDQDENGFFKFDFVGGLDVRLLPGKAVVVGDDNLVGIIGVKPVHLTTQSERKNAFALENMRIDLGEGQSKKAKVGDRATFATRFMRMGPSVSGKALDNRMGVSALIELIKHAPYAVELIAVFTVQEEIGQRGARVSAYAMNPDAAIAVDSTPAFDLPAWDNEENTSYNARLGQGAAIYSTDSYTLSDPRMISFAIKTAEANNIPYQMRQPGGGGTDAGTIHKQRGGIPSLTISIPHRFTHSPVSIARINDWQNTIRLLACILDSISKNIFSVDR